MVTPILQYIVGLTNTEATQSLCITYTTPRCPSEQGGFLRRVAALSFFLHVSPYLGIRPARRTNQMVVTFRSCSCVPEPRLRIARGSPDAQVRFIRVDAHCAVWHRDAHHNRPIEIVLYFARDQASCGRARCPPPLCTGLHSVHRRHRQQDYHHIQRCSHLCVPLPALRKALWQWVWRVAAQRPRSCRSCSCVPDPDCGSPVGRPRAGTAHTALRSLRSVAPRRAHDRSNRHRAEPERLSCLSVSRLVPVILPVPQS